MLRPVRRPRHRPGKCPEGAYGVPRGQGGASLENLSARIKDGAWGVRCPCCAALPSGAGPTESRCEFQKGVFCFSRPLPPPLAFPAFAEGERGKIRSNLTRRTQGGTQSSDSWESRSRGWARGAGPGAERGRARGRGHGGRGVAMAAGRGGAAVAVPAPAAVAEAQAVASG